jgi:hypothetical protein
MLGCNGHSRRLPGSSSLATKEIDFRCCVLGDVKAGAVEWSSSESQITAMPAVDEGGKRKWRTFTTCTSKLERVENEISRKTIIKEFYFKSCRIYSNIGKARRPVLWFVNLFVYVRYPSVRDCQTLLIPASRWRQFLAVEVDAGFFTFNRDSLRLDADLILLPQGTKPSLTTSFLFHTLGTTLFSYNEVLFALIPSLAKRDE